MAIITISRETGSLGDEITKNVAQKLNYTLATKRDIEKRILTLGFSEELLKKFDDRKISFTAALSKNRDKYYNYLRSAVLNTAANNNVIIVGRGGSEILKGVPNHIAVRIIAGLNEQVKRVSKSNNVSEHAAKKMIRRDALHQHGFYKCYYGVDIYMHPCFDLYINTSNITDIDRAGDIITGAVRGFINDSIESEGIKKVHELLISQRIVNLLIFDYKMDINNLSATFDNNEITLHGVTAHSATITRSMQLLECEFRNYKIKSDINAVQDSL